MQGNLENSLQKCSQISKIVSLCLKGLCLNCHFRLVASFLEHLPMLEKLVLCHKSCKVIVVSHKMLIMKMSKLMQAIEMKLLYNSTWNYFLIQASEDHRPLEGAPFLCEHLETIEIEYFSRDNEDEIIQVQKYLENGIKGNETRLMVRTRVFPCYKCNIN
jgi:hypothetical protein